MRRITVTLEDYDDSKIVKSTLLAEDADLRAVVSVLDGTSVPFIIDEVGSELYDFTLDYGGRYVDLSLRTKGEIKQWIFRQPFEGRVEGFLESRSEKLQLTLDNEEEFLTLTRNRQIARR